MQDWITAFRVSAGSHTKLMLKYITSLSLQAKGDSFRNCFSFLWHAVVFFVPGIILYSINVKIHHLFKLAGKGDSFRNCFSFLWHAVVFFVPGIILYSAVEHGNNAFYV